ncbi:Head decoration protein from bacteriophage origin [Escherichia coli]|uniref:Head decoration protein from bacteriophage origin n=1 Tax=Escherichia coli TaxID=562 RepID=A0A377CII7_ECOLX|nr:Head decoration protein from bacteriophage origin [Escherichia coli]
MTSKETFTHYQPLGNSDPAHTATAPGGLSAKAPAMTPLMLDTSTRKLVAWDGTTTVLPLAFWRLLLTRPAPH